MLEVVRTFLVSFSKTRGKAAVGSEPLSGVRRGKRGARIDQRREDQTHVSKHQSREGYERGVSGLLFSPSRWHSGKNRARRRETKGEKYSVWEKIRVEGRKSDARKKGRRRRRLLMKFGPGISEADSRFHFFMFLVEAEIASAVILLLLLF